MSLHARTHTPYIIFVHNLICLSPPVYFAMVTTPTPLLDVSKAGSSRHTFLWFLGRRQRSQFTSVLMDVLTSASLSKSQWAALLCEASGNDEKCREAHMVSVVWLQPSGWQVTIYKVLLECKPMLFHEVYTISSRYSFKLLLPLLT